MNNMNSKSRKLTKAYSYCIISYIIALFVSITIVISINFLHPLLVIFIADISATLVIFIISTIFKNASFYDPYWSVAPVIISFYWLINPQAINITIIRQVIVLLLVIIWSIRLTHNWIKQCYGLSHEDWRYKNLRNQKGKLFWLINLTGIQLMPTILVFLGSLSLFPILAIGNSSFGYLDVLALAITTSAIIIEALADQQLRKFVKNRDGYKSIINTGLWKYSRHPNYFGEILFWWGLYIFALAADLSFWWTIVGPISITILFNVVSIPLMEKKNLKRKPKYDSYKQTVSKLIPWFSKKQVKDFERK